LFAPWCVMVGERACCHLPRAQHDARAIAGPVPYRCRDGPLVLLRTDLDCQADNYRLDDKADMSYVDDLFDDMKHKIQSQALSSSLTPPRPAHAHAHPARCAAHIRHHTQCAHWLHGVLQARDTTCETAHVSVGCDRLRGTRPTSHRSRTTCSIYSHSCSRITMPPESRPHTPNSPPPPHTHARTHARPRAHTHRTGQGLSVHS
jgi:hypothetical protein